MDDVCFSWTNPGRMRCLERPDATLLYIRWRIEFVSRCDFSKSMYAEECLWVMRWADGRFSYVTVIGP